MDRRVLICIPARYASSRFYGKPLNAMIFGREMVTWVAEIAKSVCKEVSSKFVYAYTVLTEDKTIINACNKHGIPVAMTSKRCKNGTERCYNYISTMDKDEKSLVPDLIVNLQGDNPLCPPEFIEKLIERWENDLNNIDKKKKSVKEFINRWKDDKDIKIIKEFINRCKDDKDINIIKDFISLLTSDTDDKDRNEEIKLYTPYVHLTWDEYANMKKAKLKTPYAGTTVLVDEDECALAFSKAIIPAIRDEEKLKEKFIKSPVRRHIGLYAYTYNSLKWYCTEKQSPYEIPEGLEQLRFLHYKKPIGMVEVDYEGKKSMSGVDYKEDVERAESIIAECSGYSLQVEYTASQYQSNINKYNNTLNIKFSEENENLNSKDLTEYADAMLTSINKLKDNMQLIISKNISFDEKEFHDLLVKKVQKDKAYSKDKLLEMVKLIRFLVDNEKHLSMKKEEQPPTKL